MAPDSSAAVISLRQSAPKAMTAAERAKAYRDRKRKAKLAPANTPAPADTITPPPPVTAPVTPPKPSPDALSPVTPPDRAPRATPSRLQIAPILLNAAALALAGVGLAINGWFARSLGSSDFAGWLFLALGLAADLVALGMPSWAANLWQAGQRAARWSDGRSGW